MSNMLASLEVYAQPRMLLVLLLGFASGLPLALSASTLSIWLTEAGVSKASIGLFAAVATPYTFKFLWSPLIDGGRLPVLSGLLGHRRSWLVFSQGLLVLSIAAMSFASPDISPWNTALLALCVAISSATQDIVIDAYRVELLPAEQQGAGAGAVVLGYRFGMIASSAGALFLAAAYGWQHSYLAMAVLMGLCLLVSLLFAPEPEAAERPALGPRRSMKAWLLEYVVEPLHDFMQREQWLALLLFIMLYKFSDAFMGIMTNPFLIEIGFSKTDIASVVKLFGLWASIAGSLIGGVMVLRLGMIKSLWICGVLQMLTNLIFLAQAWIGADIYMLALTVALENGSGGMGSAAFVAFISRLCNRHFTATQYALLSSFAAFGRTWLSTPAGGVAEATGWPLFFVLSALLALPGLALLFWLQKRGKLE